MIGGNTSCRPARVAIIYLSLHVVDHFRSSRVQASWNRMWSLLAFQAFKTSSAPLHVILNAERPSPVESCPMRPPPHQNIRDASRNTVT
jgi:hypothetical protein